MARKKILVVTGSRAEYGLLRPIMRLIQKSKVLELSVLVTGMHTLPQYGSTIDEVRAEFPVDTVVPIHASDSMTHALAREITGIENHITKEAPDMLLVLGDRDEAFAAAVVAGHQNIPLAHVHGGDTLGHLVDEALRHSITKFAHLHFPASKESARRIRQMGEEAWRIHMTGSTAFDASELRSLPTRRHLARTYALNPEHDWLLVLQHPTPLDSVPMTEQILPTLNAVDQFPGEVVVIYPNSDTGSREFIEEIESRTMRTVTHMPRNEYLSLLRECVALVGNSSSGIIEAGFLRKPVVNIGNRQKGRECGINVMHVPYRESAIRRALTIAVTPTFRTKLAHMRHPYGSGRASENIVRVLEHTTINERLLHKKFANL